MAQDSDCCMCCSRNCEILGAHLKAHGFCIPAQPGESGGFCWVFSCVVVSFYLGYLLRGVAAQCCTFSFNLVPMSSDHALCFALFASRHPAETLPDVLEEADGEVQSYVHKAQSACISKVFKLWPWSQDVKIRHGTSQYVTLRHDVPSQAASSFSSIQRLPSAAQVRCGGYWFWSCQRVSSKRCQFASACSENSCKMLQGCFLYFPVCHMQSIAKQTAVFGLAVFCCFTMLHDHSWGSRPARLEECSSDAEIWDDLEPYGTFHCPSMPQPISSFHFQHGTCSLKSEANEICLHMLADIDIACGMLNYAKLLQTKSGIVPTHLWFTVHLDPYLDEGMHGDVIEAQGNWRDFLPAPASADCAGVYDCLGRRVLSWASRRILGTGPGDGIGPTLSPASWWQALLGPQLPIMCDYKV